MLLLTWLYNDRGNAMLCKQFAGCQHVGNARSKQMCPTPGIEMHKELDIPTDLVAPSRGQRHFASCENAASAMAATIMLLNNRQVHQ